MTQFQSQSTWNFDRCCLCGSLSCHQTIDHRRLTLPQLQSSIQNCKHNQQRIDELKLSIAKGYNNLRQDYIERLRKDEQAFQEWINQFYFTHLPRNVNRQLICQLTQKNYQQLPNKNIGKIISAIRKVRDGSFGESQDIEESLKEAKAFLQKLDVELINTKSIRHMGVQKVVSSAVPIDLFQSRRSMSQLSNPEDRQFQPQNYQWKNLKLNKNSRSIELSNKNIKDQDLIGQLPSLSCFRNVRQFQIRNNLITALSCKLIANNLDFITTVDIRGNMVGDVGIIYIIKGIPKLRSLLISETGATDKSGKLIAQKLQHLQLFWAQHNQLSGQTAVAVGSKPKVKVMSMAGNPIDRSYHSLLHGIFSRKGYVVL